MSANVLNVLGMPTEQCTKLASLVRKGVAFHHSGLMNKQRALIEEAFRNNKIKAICATTTLGLRRESARTHCACEGFVKVRRRL